MSSGEKRVPVATLASRLSQAGRSKRDWRDEEM